jgi:hypothetical protein
MQKKKADPYCDCGKLNLLNGVKRHITRPNESGKMFVTTADCKDACIHCGHQVFWSFENPNFINEPEGPALVAKVVTREWKGKRVQKRFVDLYEDDGSDSETE